MREGGWVCQPCGKALAGFSDPLTGFWKLEELIVESLLSCLNTDSRSSGQE